MAVDRAIRVVFDSDSNQERGATCIERIMDAAKAAGTCVDTYGTYSAGTGTPNIKLEVNGSTSVQRSVSVKVDSTITVAKWHQLLKRVLDAVHATGDVISEAWTAYSSYAPGGDSVTLTIT